MAIFPGSAIPSAVSAGYELEDSLRYNTGDTPALYKDVGSDATNGLIMTLSFWTKRGKLGAYYRIGGCKKTGTTTNLEFGFMDSNLFEFYFWDDSDTAYGINTDAVFRDCSAWYHFTLIFNAADSTAADRMQIWVNGVRQDVTARNSGYPPTDKLTGYTTRDFERFVGSSVANPDTPTFQYPFDGYLSDFACIDGTLYAASDFGELDSATNQWIPKDISDLTFGPNGFYLKFEDSANLGNDSSGNNYDFNVSGLAATDQMIDTPTNNFATWNPLYIDDDANRNVTWTEGNTKWSTSGSGGDSGGQGTFGVSSGKWYWEYYVNTISSDNGYFGATEVNNDGGGGNNFYFTTNTGSLRSTGETDQTGLTAASAGDILSIAIDLDASPPQGSMYLNNSQLGSTMDIVAGVTWSPFVYNANTSVTKTVTINCGQDSSFAGATTAGGNQDSNGVGDFKYAVPSNHLAVCTSNLPSPEIALPGENFNTVIYTGTASVTKNVTGVGFQPDFCWLKTRVDVASHALFDSVRGTNEVLNSNTTAAEGSDSGAGFSAFDSDGFTVIEQVSAAGSINAASGMVSWNWKAGGAPTVDNSAGAGATPTAGSVKVDGSNYGSALAGATELIRGSSNTTAGFSVVKYEGDGTSSNSFAHLLSQAPEMIICKNLDAAYDWPVAYQATTDQATVYLDTTAATFTGSNQWNSSVPTSTLVNIGGSSETNSRPGQGDKIVAYCFHSVEGYSKVGRYEGNGSTDGTFVYTGFSPAMVIIKNIDDAQDWSIIDNKRPGYNEVDEILSPNLNNAEDAGTALDFTSNGFKCRNGSDINNDAKTMIYIAFAESPFKTSNAR